MPGVSRCDRGDDTRVLPTHCTRGCGCNGHPAFPTPWLFLLGETSRNGPGVLRRGGAGACLRLAVLKIEVGVCAKRSLTPPRARAPRNALVMPGLDPGIHHLRKSFFEGDHRVKPGDDDLKSRLFASEARSIPCPRSAVVKL